MNLAKLFYDFMYRYSKVPWDIGPRQELVAIVENKEIKPCRVIDLGSGTASNCIFLAKHGFDVTGVDYSSKAIELGQRKAKNAGIEVNFVIDDLTDLKKIKGTFDFLVDYGTFDDLNYRDRALYVKSMLPITHIDSKFLFFTFEWPFRRWEQFLMRFIGVALQPGEVHHWFGNYFDIKLIKRKIDFSSYPAGWAVYLMTRK